MSGSTATGDENARVARRLEAGLLTLLLARPDLIPNATATLTSDAWTDPRFRALFERLGAVASNAGETIDPVPVFISAGIQNADLAPIAEGIGRDVAGFASEMLALAGKRALALASSKALYAARNGVALGDAIRDAQSDLGHIERRYRRGGPRGIGAIMDEVVRDLEAGVDRRTVPTGFERLDDLTGGLGPGQLIVLAGRPGMGKSTLAYGIVAAAVRAGRSVHLLTLEVRASDALLAIACGMARVSLTRAKQGQLDDAGWQALVAAMPALAAAKLTIEEPEKPTASEVVARARSLDGGPADLVVLDHMGLLAGTGPARSRYEAMTGITRDLKLGAKLLGRPLFVLHQLNREVYGRKDHRPRLSDLRDSGSVEQDADVVLLLHREGYFDTSAPDGDLAEVEVAKNRFGPRGMAELRWCPLVPAFENVPWSSGRPGADLDG